MPIGGIDIQSRRRVQRQRPWHQGERSVKCSRSGRPGSPHGRQAKPRTDKYAGDHINVKFLEDVAAEVINRFLDARIKRSQGVPKTVNGMRAMFHRLFEYAIKHHGFCSRDRRYPNPAAAIERRHEPAPQIRFLTLGQIEEPLAALKDHPNLYAIVATCIYAGLRREEVTWLTHEDADLELRLIRVRKSGVDRQEAKALEEFGLPACSVCGRMRTQARRVQNLMALG